MFTKCVNCSFFVQDGDESCLNCGFKEPTVQLSTQGRNLQTILGRIVLADLILFILFSFIGLILTPSQYRIENLLSILFISFLMSSAFSSVLGYFYYASKHNTERLNRESANSNSLKGKEKIIRKRLSELNRRGIQIDAVLDKIRQDDSKQLQQVRHRLLSAREVVIGQIARYEVQTKKIEIARLQNRVSPYINRLHRLNEVETEKGLIAIEETKHELKQIEHNLTNYYAIEFPKPVQPEKENFLSQIVETEESCDKIREALLSRQATNALRGISPIEDTLKSRDPKEIAHAIDTFNIQSTLTDFSESFEELENEYRRVQAEGEVSRNLLNDID